MINAVVFDFDGVILNTNQLKYDAFFDIFSFEDKDIVSNILINYRENTRYKIIQHILLSKKNISEEFPGLKKMIYKYTDKYIYYINQRINKVVEIPGSSKSLEILQKRYLLFLNSTTPLNHLSVIVKLKNMDKYFTQIYGSPNLKVENFRHIMKKYLLKEDEFVFIGDSKSDLNAAKEIGCPFIGITNKFNDFSELDKFPVSKDLNNIPTLVDKFN